MFERFTDRARRVVVLAQEEARDLQHDYIGPEHVLLGLIAEGAGVGFAVIEALAESPGAVRTGVQELVGRGAGSPTGHIKFTPKAKRVLELSLREALQFGHDYIGTEHQLLGIIREGDNPGASVLLEQGVTLNQARAEVSRILREYHGGPDSPPGPRSTAGIVVTLRSIEARLARIERHLGIEAPGASEGAGPESASAGPATGWPAGASAGSASAEPAAETGHSPTPRPAGDGPDGDPDGDPAD